MSAVSNTVSCAVAAGPLPPPDALLSEVDVAALPASPSPAAPPAAAAGFASSSAVRLLPEVDVTSFDDEGTLPVVSPTCLLSAWVG